MKKTFALISLLTVALAANAETEYNLFTDQDLIREMFRTIAIIFVLYVVMSFILRVVRLFLDDRLKKMMLEKETPVSVIALLLPKRGMNRNSALKWFSILVAIGIGLTGIGMTLPVGIHTVVIMTFCVALGFLGYYFLTKKGKSEEETGDE